MMEGRIDDGHLVVFDNDHEQMSRFIDCKFRMWHWKTQAQFKKWAKEMEKILADDFAKYTSESLKTKSLGSRKDALFWQSNGLPRRLSEKKKKLPDGCGWVNTRLVVDLRWCCARDAVQRAI
jgi:hypothetical protein